MQSIVVCDDQSDVLDALGFLLKGAGYRADLTASPSQALEAVTQSRPALVLTDMNFTRDTTSGAEGLTLLDALRGLHDAPPVIVMTAWGEVDLAVEAMRRGAADFVQKPWDNTRLLAALERCISEAKGQRWEKDAARRVQQRLMAPEVRQIGGLEYRASFEPAQEVGGDYHDLFQLGGADFSFVLADVSGKGMAAALLMANLQALFHAQESELRRQPVALLKRINEHFHSSTAPEHYCTLFYAVYESGRLRYINCGHPAATLERHSGALETLEASERPIGLFAQWDGTEQTVAFQPGDRLVVVSDGFTEADEAEDDRTRIDLVFHSPDNSATGTLQ
jgi:sigma-B regulation protein RsbU (phosphoserine phosphatase)